MQTIITTTILIVLAIIVYRQHQDLKALYKSSQEQQEINAEQTSMNQAYSLGLLELRGQINRNTGKVKPLELPPFISQVGGNRYAN